MGLFTRNKSKSKKADKADQAGKGSAAKQIEPVPAPPSAYKHTPQHAAADAASNGPRGQTGRSRAGSQESMPMQSQQCRSFGGPNSAQNGFTTPTPGPLIRNQDSWTGSAAGSSMQSKSIYSHSRPDVYHAPSFDSPMLGNPKMKAAARDRGYVDAPSDSGYGSPGPSSLLQSQKTSVNHSPQESVSVYHNAQASGMLPELALGGDLNDGQGYAADSGSASQWTRASRDVSPEQNRTDMREGQKPAMRKSRSQRSLGKQTRFEEPAEAMPSQSQQQEALRVFTTTQDQIGYSSSRADVVSPVGDDDAVATQDPGPMPHHQDQHEDLYTQYTDAQHATAGAQTDNMQYIPAQNQQAQPEYDTRSPYAEAYTHDNRGRHPQPSAAQHTQTEYESRRPARAESTASRSYSLPPLSVLDGLKVNKRGRILDEEGDQIGELVEGDIIDCVRQKANAYGEVLDEYGGVVGRVRVVHRSTPSPYPRSESRASGSYFMSCADPSGASAVPSMPDYIQSTQQRPFQYQQVSRGANEAAAPHQPDSNEQSHDERRPSIAPLDLQGQDAVVELDASRRGQSHSPVYDMSEPFMPLVQDHAPPCGQQESSPERAQQNNGFTSTAASDSGYSTLGETPGTLQKSLSDHRLHTRPDTLARLEGSSFEQNARSDQATFVDTNGNKQESGAQSNAFDSKVDQLRSAEPRLLARSVSDNIVRSGLPSIPQDKTLSTLSSNPTMFKYKGDIPASDVRITPGRGKAPPLPPFPRQAFVGASGPSALTGGGPNARLQPGMPMNRRVSTGNIPMGNTKRPGMNTRYSTNMPLVRSPLRSHETSPPESEEGSNESDTVGAMQFSNYQQHGRAASMKTMGSTASANTAKPRTYFSHAGRVAPGEGALQAAKAAATKTQAAVDAEPKPKVEEKKKKRLSLFGKKK